ncbi:MAG TPA: reverse transcriptase domain-containing protein [Bryobacteraceae bacterium]|nr:reverse transcriptase domain-containing protein [Bryobacteraceae bacterium]
MSLPGRAIANVPSRLLASQLDLHSAWSRVQERAGMPGVDGMPVRRFARSADLLLNRLTSRLARNEYTPLPLRVAELEKKNGSPRLLLVPSVADRIILSAAASWIAARLNPSFDAASFAYRSGLGVHDALRALAQLRSEGFVWILDADIRSFFDSISHTVLLARLRQWLGDSSPLVRWCELWIGAAVWDGERVGVMQCGVPQGSPLSPILANLYLDEFDEHIRRAKVRLIRYADDFLLLARTPFDLEHGRGVAEQALSSLGLELNAEKTHVTSFAQGFRFLGAEIRGSSILLPFEKRKTPRKPVYVAPVLPAALLRAWRSGSLRILPWTWQPHANSISEVARPATPRSPFLVALAGPPPMPLSRAPRR